MELEQRITLWEEARSLANIALWSIELQVKRLEREEPEIDEFALQWVADFHFLVTAISRLRRAAELACEVVDISEQIRDFDQELDGWRKMRNALEHVDDYWRHKGRDKSIMPGALPVFEFGPVIRWLDAELDLSACRQASYALFQAMKKQFAYSQGIGLKDCSRPVVPSMTALVRLSKVS